MSSTERSSPARQYHNPGGKFREFNVISTVNEYLLISGYQPLTTNLLRHYEVTCVIDVSNLPKDILLYDQSEKSKYKLDVLRIELEDEEDSDLRPWFRKAAAKIEEHRVKVGRTVVHCYADQDSHTPPNDYITPPNGIVHKLSISQSIDTNNNNQSIHLDLSLSDHTPANSINKQNSAADYSPSRIKRWTQGSMEYAYSVWNGIRWFYNEVNPATLTGAIDVLVVEQPDGSLQASPFHVRFGKYGVLHSREKIVDITVNGEPVDDLQMKLGETGEAFFVDERLADELVPDYLATSPLPTDSVDTEQLIEHGIKELHKERARAARQQLSLLNTNYTSMPDLTQHTSATTSSSTESSGTRNTLNQSDNLFDIDDLVQPATPQANSSEQTSDNDGDRTPTVVDSRVSRPVGRHSRRTSLAKIVPLRSTVIDFGDKSENVSQPSSRDSTPEGVPSGFMSDSEMDTVVRKENVRLEMGQIAANAGPTDWKWGELPDTAASTPTQEKINAAAEAAAKGAVDGNKPSAGWQFPFAWSSSNTTATKATASDQGVTLEELDNSDAAVRERYLNMRSSKRDTPSGGSTRTGSGSESPGLTLPSPPPSQVSPRPTQDDCSSLQPEQSPQKSAVTDAEPESSSSVQLPETIPEESVANANPVQDRSPESIDDAGYNSQPGSVAPPDGRQSPVWSDNGELPTDSALSLCGYRDPMPQDVFEKDLITFELFQSSPQTYLMNEALVLRMDGQYFHGMAAHAALISRAVFRQSLPETSLRKASDASKSPQDKTPASTGGSWLPWRRQPSIEPSSPGKGSPPIPVNTNQPDQAPLKDIVGADAAKAVGAVASGTSSQTSFDSTQVINRYLRSLRLNSDRLKSLKLKPGQNECRFSVTTRLQGTSVCVCHIYLFHYTDKIVVSDIDGTITKSDVLGHVMPRIGATWEHEGVAALFDRIVSNGYKMVYLSSRAIGMSQTTKHYLRSVEQDNLALPFGPILLSPTSLLAALHKEVIEKRPEEFKMAALKDVQSLFPENFNPFYSGFGNRITDVVSYKHVGIPLDRILTINPSGELVRADYGGFRSSYKGMATDVVDYIFPPLTEERKRAQFSRPQEFSHYTYWRDQPSIEKNVPENEYSKYLAGASNTKPGSVKK